MTARRGKGGRTTPKGTVNPTRNKRAASAKPGAKPAGWTPASPKSDKSRQGSSRPESHNRGNR